MEDDIVYFQWNDWAQEHSNAKRFFNELLVKGSDEIDAYLKKNQICILSNCFDYDMAVNYLVTCKKQWIHENYPEIEEFASSEPKDWLYADDRKCFLPFSEENFGMKESEYKDNGFDIFD